MAIVNTIKVVTSHPLNQDNKLRSVFRFVKWQIESRMASGAVVYDWVNGSKLYVRTGEVGLTGNIYTGLHDFSDMGYLLHVLQDDELFIDVGANAGSYTILACAAAGLLSFIISPLNAAVTPGGTFADKAIISIDGTDGGEALARVSYAARHGRMASSLAR